MPTFRCPGCGRLSGIRIPGPGGDENQDAELQRAWWDRLNDPISPFVSFVVISVIVLASVVPLILDGVCRGRDDGSAASRVHREPMVAPLSDFTVRAPMTVRGADWLADGSLLVLASDESQSCFARRTYSTEGFRDDVLAFADAVSGTCRVEVGPSGHQALYQCMGRRWSRGIVDWSLSESTWQPPWLGVSFAWGRVSEREVILTVWAPDVGEDGGLTMVVPDLEAEDPQWTLDDVDHLTRDCAVDGDRVATLWSSDFDRPQDSNWGVSFWTITVEGATVDAEIRIPPPALRFSGLTTDGETAYLVALAPQGSTLWAVSKTERSVSVLHDLEESGGGRPISISLSPDRNEILIVSGGDRGCVLKTVPIR